MVLVFVAVEDFEDLDSLDVLVVVGADVSTGSTTLSEVAAAVAVTGSRRLSMALSMGSRRKDILAVC